MAAMCGRLAGLGLIALLAGCGGESGAQFAPVCPRPAILGDAGDLQRFRGQGRDFLDTTLQGRITSINGSCTQDGSRAVVATVSVGMELTRGPAAVGRAADVAFFVAVSQGDRVLDKQVYTLRVVFPENTDRLRLTGDSVDLRLPVSPTMKADTYQVTAGFQLTPEELAENRKRMRR
ncbi:MAG: hypothetical protein RQ966_16355 [Acetobacteraceae bacterium]|nr:hypothetical protein [Acetobacteraceae bacterium]